MDYPDLRLDGAILNSILHLGSERDVEAYSRPGGLVENLLPDAQLEDLYASDEICKRVCTLIPGQMARGGVRLSIEDGPDRDARKKVSSSIAGYVRRAGILNALMEASILSSIYNKGAGVVLDVDDGQGGEAGWRMPVNRKRINRVSIAYVLPGQSLQPVRDGSVLQRIRHFSFPLMGLGGGAEEGAEDPYLGLISQIHPDRVLWLPGGYAPPSARSRHGGEVGILQRFWPHYSRYISSLQAGSNILHRSEVLEIAKKGATEMLAAAGNEEGRRRLEDQLRVYVAMLTNLGAILTDLDRTKLNVIRRSTSGFPPMINEFKRAMIASSGLTEMMLFGLTTVGGGLSGVDMRDRMHLADAVATRQEEEWRQPLEQFFELALAAKDGPTKGKPPRSWTLEFPYTLRLTPLEEAQMRSTQAQADATYASLGLDAESILLSRFDGPWTAETQLLNPIPKSQPPEVGVPMQEALPEEPGEPAIEEGEVDEMFTS